MTTTRTYGYLYDRERPVKGDAANIRRHIKTMVKAGLLPADWSYSVRKRSATHSWAVDVTAMSPRPTLAVDPNEVFRAMHSGDYPVHPETGQVVTYPRDCETVEAAAVYATLKDLVDGHNHDGSDVTTDYFDVKFYGGVTLDTAPGVERIRT